MNPCWFWHGKSLFMLLKSFLLSQYKKVCNYNEAFKTIFTEEID